MKLGIGIKTSLSQTLTPQQIQYLKLLQLPMAQLEQQVMQEIEMNPMLEDAGDEEFDAVELKPLEEETYPESVSIKDTDKQPVVDSNDYEMQKEYMDDKSDPFEFSSLMWEGSDPDLPQPKNNRSEDGEDYEPFQIKDNGDFMQDMIQQLRLQGTTEEEEILAEVIIGNVDSDGYMRRELTALVEETNENITEINFNRTTANQNSDQHKTVSSSYIYQNELSSTSSQLEGNYAKMFGTVAPTIANQPKVGHKNTAHQENSNDKVPLQKATNPALFFALSSDSKTKLKNAQHEQNELLVEEESQPSSSFTNGNNGLNLAKPDYEFVKSQPTLKLLEEITITDAERVLQRIMHLDPPGLGSRTVQECLIVQLESKPDRNPYQNLALDILRDSYEAFAKKHYPVIMKNHDLTEGELRWAIEEIRSLNPKPGGLDYQSEMNTVIPDFMIETEEDTNELVISVNDSRVPQLKLSQAYEAMRKEAKTRNVNKETREWLRGKREDAKFLMQALKQRKNTMLKVMTAIAHFQKEFFFEGPDGLCPLIYKDIAEKTGLDISTVCRIVNGKYVLTPFGTFELKFFFSESLPSEEGEEVSTRIIKNKLKEIIDNENKSKPYSDEKLGQLLKEEGFLVARRTVAKYREQMNIPVARLRKEL